MVRKSWNWGRKHRAALCAAVTLASVLPFCAKAFHIDDPFYIWVGQYIQSHPFDFYGAQINWYGREMPVYAMHASPPLVPYLLAVWATVFGWSEISLHVLYAGFAVLLSVSVFFVASRLTQRPIFATLLAQLCPVTMVCASNIMLDLPMTAFFVSAIALWMTGLDSGRNRWFFAAGIAAAAAGGAKYFGLAAAPLLLVYTVVVRRRAGWWIVPLLIPVLGFVAEQLCTYALYGRSIFVNAATVAENARALGSVPWHEQWISGLAFTGGCAAFLVFFVPVVWPGRVLRWIPALATVLGVCVFEFHGREEPLPWFSVAQCAVMVLGGLHLVLLLIDDARRARDAGSLLLALWAVGTLFFAVVTNWSVTARSLLPIAAPAAILLARRIDRRGGAAAVRWRIWPAFALSVALAVAVAWADYAWAQSARDTARRYGSGGNTQGVVLFQGHWGFQYYMQLAGAKAFDFDRPQYRAGDYLVVPQNNANIRQLPEQYVYGVKTSEVDATHGLALMCTSLGAGFYSSSWGPMPYAFGPVPPDRYHALLLGPPKQ